MAWSYSGNPTPGSIDEIRFQIGDTNSNQPLLQDGEIQYVMDNYGSTEEVAAVCAEAIAAKLTGLADMSAGNAKISYSQQAKSYMDLAAKLRGRLSLVILPYAGGLSKAEKVAARANTNLTQPFFRRRQMEDDVT